jgi:hypothetical protein
VDGVTVGAGSRGPITSLVQERFLGIARAQLPDPYGWLTTIPVLDAASR